MPNQRRVLSELEVVEVSLVRRPANVGARVVLTKGYQPATKPEPNAQAVEEAKAALVTIAEGFLSGASYTPFEAASAALGDTRPIQSQRGYKLREMIGALGGEVTAMEIASRIVARQVEDEAKAKAAKCAARERELMKLPV